jgi:hypothetical protein
MTEVAESAHCPACGAGTLHSGSLTDWAPARFAPAQQPKRFVGPRTVDVTAFMCSGCGVITLRGHLAKLPHALEP